MYFATIIVYMVVFLFNTVGFVLLLLGLLLYVYILLYVYVSLYVYVLIVCLRLIVCLCIYIVPAGTLRLP